MENLTGGTPPVRYLPCVVPCKLYFCIYYIIIIGLLGVYAIGWQQVIKNIPLTTAFANKAVTVVWGIVWGRLFFGESITFGKLVGAAMVVGGVIIFAKTDEVQDGQ